MIIWIVLLVVYLIGVYIAWGKIMSWNNTTLEKIGLTIIRPLAGLLHKCQQSEEDQWSEYQ